MTNQFGTQSRRLMAVGLANELRVLADIASEISCEQAGKLPEEEATWWENIYSNLSACVDTIEKRVGN